MSLGGLLTAKPLAIGAVALLVVSGALLAWTQVLKSQRDTAQADLRSMTTSRDAFKQRADDLAAANRAYDASFATLSDELKLAQGESRRLEAEGRAALAAAEARARDSDRVLRRFMDRHAQQVRAPDCQRALASVQSNCPAMEGY